MKRKFLSVLLLILLVGNSSCGILETSNKTGLRPVASNVCLKTGTDIDGKTILSSTDFIGFLCEYNNSSQEYTFLFQLTDEGQEKMIQETAKIAETVGCMSFWVGDENIASPVVTGVIKEDRFALDIDISEDDIDSFINKLEGNQ